MQTSDMVREKQLNIRLSEEEAARLEFLTTHYGINTAALFRMLMKREGDALGFKWKPQAVSEIVRNAKDLNERFRAEAKPAKTTKKK